MTELKQKIKDFVAIPRKIKDDHLEGKLSRNELDVLIWIWFNTNPYNGYFTADYMALEREFHNRINYNNMRKIISSLRRKQWICFLSHKGRKGSFPIYPIDFLLTNGQIQSLDYLKDKLSITTQSQSKEQPDTQPEHKLEGQNHNFKEQKEGLIKQFSVDNQAPQITTPYNDNNTETNNLIGKKKYLEKSVNRFSSNEKRIPVDSFLPHNYEEEKCKEIAKALGEKDLRYLLSRLKKLGGFNVIERVWGVYEENVEKKDIKNPPAYFNDLLEKELGLKEKQFYLP